METVYNSYCLKFSMQAKLSSSFSIDPWPCNCLRHPFLVHCLHFPRFRFLLCPQRSYFKHLRDLPAGQTVHAVHLPEGCLYQTSNIPNSFHQFWTILSLHTYSIHKNIITAKPFCFLILPHLQSVHDPPEDYFCSLNMPLSTAALSPQQEVT